MFCKELLSKYSRVQREIGMILTVIMFSFFLFAVPFYEKTEHKITIETAGILNTDALSDGVQIIAVNIDGQSENLPELLQNPDWRYENGTYTWNESIEGSKNRIELTADFRELEIVFLQNSWCGGANIYIDDELAETIDFYTEKDTAFSWKINGREKMGINKRVTLSVIISSAIWVLILCINSLKIHGGV